MAGGSFLALLARHSLHPVRQHSKLAAAQIPLFDYERLAQYHVNHPQLAEAQQPGGALSSFHVALAERLQQLQLQGSGNAHLNWLLDALACTLSTHSSLQSAFTAPGAGASLVAINKHRADEVLNLLDVCTALKQVADDMERQFACFQHALQSVDEALTSHTCLSSGRLRAAAHRLSKCLFQEPLNVPCITRKHYRPLAEARSALLLAAKRELQSSATPQLLDPAAALLSQALDGALLTSLLVLAAAVSSLAPASPRKYSGTITSACKMIVKYLHQGAKSTVSTPWAALLRQLHHDLRQEDSSGAGGSLFRELQGLHSAATNIHATIACTTSHSIDLALVKHSVESLRKSLREAQSCISTMRMQLASFFQALVALRLSLLDS